MGEPQPVGSSKDVVEMKGVVEELLPAATFKIRLENGHSIRGYLAGKMRLHRIRLLPGDEVKVAITPYDLTRGRIVYRY
ncbi:MAG: Translation initiation factor 1 [Candidatus Magasanikbacteria bacterium]|nr:Translation initiation factor 1 [Candidatus Magasanikbacteria bacterium]